MKKLAVVAGGWHFPLAFYRQIAEQQIPEGWQVDLFCVSHRDPKYAVKEKKDTLKSMGYSRRELYDRILYENVASIEEIQALGFKYSLEPNTMGDWGITNQWLEKYDYREYDKFLFTHDDNFILTDQMFVDILPQEEWLILTNSDGHTPGKKRRWLARGKEFTIRGSFEFFTKEMMDLLGGRFDDSTVTVTREGETSNATSFADISDWNNMLYPLLDLVKSKGLMKRIHYLSRYYRMSRYCLEGERGLISKTEPLNTAEEDQGLDEVERFYATQK